MARFACAILSKDNLLHNLAIISKLAPKSKIIAMVKANAYGHGLRSVSKYLDDLNLYSFGVASIDEAVALRNANVSSSITLMEGVFEPEELSVAAAENFDVVLHNWEQLEWLEKIINTENKYRVWLKIDTGMGRLGFSVEEAPMAYAKLSSLKNISFPIGVMSHLACAEDKEHRLNQVQIKNFTQFITNLPVIKSFCNSAGIFNFPDQHYDVVRPGIILYGLSPFKDKTGPDLGLRPVMTLKSKLISVKIVSAGGTIGYGARAVCNKDTKIGVIAMGYGDGYPITAKDGAPIWINNKICPLIGRVSMDMMCIDLTNYPDAKIGDEVEFWGNNLPLEQLSKYTHNLNYDISTNVQNRVKFIWK